MPQDAPAHMPQHAVPQMPTAVQGGVRRLLRLEGLALMLVSLWAYQRSGASWSEFAMLFLLPDLALLAYAFNPRIAAVCYNLTHASLGAWALLMAGVMLEQATFLSWGLIWLAHIGFDRALGYGLKYSVGFRYTHLGKVGKADAA